jgi:proline iminopeptidase
MSSPQTETTAPDRGAVPRALRKLAESALGIYGAYWAYGIRHPRLLRPSRSDERPLPGDDLVPAATAVKDLRIDIGATPEAVWPWLVQLGYGRAGWYTWNPFDNGSRPSLDRIDPSLQGIRVGDYLPDGPRAADGFGQWWVRRCEAPRLLVAYSRRNPFSGRELRRDEAPRAGDPVLECSWAFVLEQTGPARTRLTVRVRARVLGEGLALRLGRLAAPFFNVGDTVMEWTMLDGVRRRVEAGARS